MQNHNYSFVVRIWLESTQGDQNAVIWRGSIEQVGSDCRIYFSDLDGITRIIETQVGMQATSSHTGWQQAWAKGKASIEKLWKQFFS